MRADARFIRRALGTWLSALMLVLSVAIPMLERADLVVTTVLASEHSHPTCPTAHDHTICTQFGANLSAPSSSPVRQQLPRIVRLVQGASIPTPVASRSAGGVRARAPPVA